MALYTTLLYFHLVVSLWIQFVLSFNQFDSQSQIIGYSAADENGKRELNPDLNFPKFVIATVKQVFPPKNQQRDETNNSKIKSVIPSPELQVRSNSPEQDDSSANRLRQISLIPESSASTELDSKMEAFSPSWRIVDDFALSSIISANQKFGYIMHKPQYKKYRYEERAEDGVISGEFGILPHDGAMRGVQYAADPSVDPTFIYLTLMKFTSF